MDNDEKVDDIIAMLDNFILNAGGHMNIQVNEPEAVDQVIVDTYHSTECSGDVACKLPNLHDGMDDENEV
jgi:hypothetical protein